MPCTDNGDSISHLMRLSQSGQFQQVQTMSLRLLAETDQSVESVLQIANILLGAGYLSSAQMAYDQAIRINPNDVHAKINQTALLLEIGQPRAAWEQYHQLENHYPNNASIRRSALTSLEYIAQSDAIARFDQVRSWGAWIDQLVAGPYPRPQCVSLLGRPLRIGYVSADLCQHTVGLFIKDVLRHHDTGRVKMFIYSSGTVKDWVTNSVAACSTLRDVSTLDDRALVHQIQQDKIDVLIDLSGHTAGSRLTAFAYRPAPVMVSWLGYFATTGLSYIDAVLLDEWHAPDGMESQFVEPIIRLPQGRLCYQPVPWAPSSVAPPPCIESGHITFGSFNNTAKYNDGVFDIWAKVLLALPDSRLVLKWRTFNDEPFKAKVTQAFVERGIALERIELRGPSFHADVLKEYADIDVALDPFPFTGGLTSCEALWMGVPVVTWPQSRVVSRQTHAILNQIGLPELSAVSENDYIRVAVELANDQPRLIELRASLRSRMQVSPLMDVVGFTRNLEDTLIHMYQRIAAEEGQKFMNAQTILHVGPGHRSNGAKLPAAFQGSDWKEIRLDIDPTNEPDIVGSMLDMSAVDTDSVDAIYSSHNIEHVHTHEVPQMLSEFLRVLKPGGFLLVTCPDLQTVCQLIAEDKLTDAAYNSPAGPITPLDILYGHGNALAAGHHYMAHKTGFTLKSLTAALQSAGFGTQAGKRRTKGLDLWVLAIKGTMDEAPLVQLANQYMPS